MPEHVHGLLRPADGVPVKRFLVNVKLTVARRVIDRWKELRAPVLEKLRHTTTYRFWQPGGGFDRNVRDEAAFTKEIRYTHHNPVKRKLAGRPELWAWSSARSWMGSETRWPHDVPPGDPRAWKEWEGFL